MYFIKKRENDADQADRVLFEPSADDEYKSIGLPNVNDPVWDANRAFLCRPRFLRTWVLQEAVLARKLLLICGDWDLTAKGLAQFSSPQESHF